MTWPEVRRDVLVIGGGPAGMGAAAECARLGLRTLLVDERPALGGQIYRQPPQGISALGHDARHRRGKRLIGLTDSSGAEVWLDTAVWGLRDDGRALANREGSTFLVRTANVVLATGAYDAPVPFEGWTLPGVLTAGAAQALVKTQGALPGRQIVVAGSGPQVLAFAADLARGGGRLAAVAEAAPLPRPPAALRLLSAGAGVPTLLRDGAGYAGSLRRRGVRLLRRHGIVRAEGDGAVERVVLARYDGRWRPLPGTERTIAADALCVGYGFHPSVELARLARADLAFDRARGGWCIRRDEWLATSVPGVFAAGDGAGIGGALAAYEEGRLAAVAVARRAGRLGQADADAAARPLRRRLARLDRFRLGLTAVYPAADGLDALPGDATIICRCEEVTRGELERALIAGQRDPGTAKAVTRASMGLCQGRNCASSIAAITAAVTGERPEDFPWLGQRFPVRPVPIAGIAAEPPSDGGGH